MMPSFFRRMMCVSFATLIAAPFAALFGCQQEMGDQPSYRPLQPSKFFADGRAARPLVEGTVARGQLETDIGLFTGRRERLPAPVVVAAAGQEGDKPAVKLVNPDNMSSYIDGFPVAVTANLLERGRERYSIYCAVCHGEHGYGDGIIVRRGFKAPPSYHIDRLRDAPVGYLFAVETYGYGAMADYADQVSPQDRWAIVAYIRALQLSQHARLADLVAADRDRILSALETKGRGSK
jgi:mono/diheme cytochrome c family protein